MSIRLSTAGISVKYAVEKSKGVQPTDQADWKVISEIKEIPEINPEPSNLETTTLAETEYRTYIPGLKDLGGALGFTANLTQDFKTEWEAMVTAYEAAKEQGMNTWYMIDIPGITEGCFFQGEPTALGVPAAAVDAVLETTAYITPTSAPTWGEKPTGE